MSEATIAIKEPYNHLQIESPYMDENYFLLHTIFFIRLFFCLEQAWQFLFI